MVSPPFSNGQRQSQQKVNLELSFKTPPVLKEWWLIMMMIIKKIAQFKMIWIFRPLASQKRPLNLTIPFMLNDACKKISK